MHYQLSWCDQISQLRIPKSFHLEYQELPTQMVQRQYWEKAQSTESGLFVITRMQNITSSVRYFSNNYQEALNHT